MSPQAVIVVLELPGNIGDSPFVIFDFNREMATRRLVQTLAGLDKTLTGGLRAYADEDFPDVPNHRTASYVAIKQWLEGFNEIASFWWTFYSLDNTVGQLDVLE